MVWYGKNCKNVLKSKARLMAERINKNERKGKAGIHIFCQGDEPGIFWQSLVEFADEDSYPEGPIVDSVPEDFKPLVPRLYTVGLGMGYLELPQVNVFIDSTQLDLGWDILSYHR